MLKCWNALSINEKEEKKQLQNPVRFDDSEFDCTYWENVVDIQHKNYDLVVLNAYKRNRMKRKNSCVHENETEYNKISKKKR